MSTGKITAYSDDANGGVIAADNGRTYFFHKREWRSPEIKPQVEIHVTFSADKKHACDVHFIQPPTPKNKL